MPIEVRCDCGKSMTVPDKLAGKKGKCPTCGKVLNIPAAVEGGPPADQGGGAGKTCSNCGKSWPTDAVICVACGTNLITGEKLTTET